MAVLCRALGLLFVLNPATGSTAIARLLVDRFGGEWLPAQDGPVVPRKHSTLAELLAAGLLSPDARSKLCVATTVRNPYDRLVSIHAKRRGIPDEQLARPDFYMNRQSGGERAEEVRWIRDHDFRAWIRRRFVRNWALRTLLGRPPSVYERYVEGVDVVMRYERLQQDFDALIRRLGAEPVPIPRVNVSRERIRRDYREEYDRVSRLLVRIGQRRDLERFGYGFDAAGPGPDSS